MKKYIVILLTFVMLIFCGCDIKSMSSTTDNLQDESMFIIIEKSYTFTIVYHRDTKVMYAISSGGNNSGNFCLLVNPDGMPMLWQGENEGDE